MSANEPGISSLSRDNNNWRKDLVFQLQERNRKQTYCFADLISLRKIHLSIYLVLLIQTKFNSSSVICTKRSKSYFKYGYNLEMYNAAYNLQIPDYLKVPTHCAVKTFN